MLKKNADPKAVRLLMKYDVLAEGDRARGNPLAKAAQAYMEAHVLSDADLAYLKAEGLAFEFVRMTHDEAIRKCFVNFEHCEKDHVTDLFIAGLGLDRPDLRSGLSAYAIMKTMPRHTYQETASGYCAVCSGRREKDLLDLTALNKDRFRFGSLFLLKTPYEIQFFLGQHCQIERVRPAKKDFSIFNEIIRLLDEADDEIKPKDAHKLLKGIFGFKATSLQVAAILETLGYCGILQTAEHSGYLEKYTNPGLSPNKSRSSDWAYPVDFWTGKDGVNWKAVKFWFGSYPEVFIPLA